MSLISDALMRWLPIQTRVPGGRLREAESPGIN
jgi:hypothetical protein